MNAVTVIAFQVQIDPKPATRPRFHQVKPKAGKGFVSTYNARPYQSFLDELADAMPTHSGPPLEGALLVRLECVVKRPKTTERDTPRGDVDNYAKGILDVLTLCRYWNDDDQVTTLIVKKRFCVGSEQPCILIQIHGSMYLLKGPQPAVFGRKWDGSITDLP